MLKIFLIFLIGLLLITGCATTMKPVVYVTCLGSVFVHKGVLLSDSKKTGIVIDVGNKKIKKFNSNLCAFVKTDKKVKYK